MISSSMQASAFFSSVCQFYLLAGTLSTDLLKIALLDAGHQLPLS